MIELEEFVIRITSRPFSILGTSVVFQVVKAKGCPAYGSPGVVGGFPSLAIEVGFPSSILWPLPLHPLPKIGADKIIMGIDVELFEEKTYCPIRILAMDDPKKRLAHPIWLQLRVSIIPPDIVSTVSGERTAEYRCLSPWMESNSCAATFRIPCWLCSNAL